MAGAEVKLLLLVVISFAVICEIRSPPSPRRGTPRARSSRRDSSPLDRIRTGLSGFSRRFRSLSSLQNDHEAGPSRRSRSRGSSPDVQILPAPRSVSRQASQPPQPPFPFIPAGMKVNGPDDPLVKMFEKLSAHPGDPDMTLEDFKAKKTSLLQKLNEDICPTDKKAGGNKCTLALKEFKEINSKWRGPCGNAFMGWCQPWGTSGWRCSFFMKTFQKDNWIRGYSHTMEDCIKALSPEDFEQDLNNLVDTWIV